MFTRNYWHGVLAGMSLNWLESDTILAMDGSWESVLRHNCVGSDYTYEYTSILANDGNYGKVYENEGSQFGLNALNNGTCSYYTSLGNQYNTTSYVNYLGVILGDGTGTPTINDYKLFGNRITTFSGTVSLQNNHSNGKLILEAIYYVTNTGTSTFTIKELGIMTPFTKAPTKTFLVEHTLLLNPVTINPGETKPISYNILMV